MKQNDTTIGFIGQGWIGKHYADDFENRGFKTVRYALEKPYCDNKDAIQDCAITFIAVPTPTTPEGFDDSALRAALAVVGKGNIAVIKSTTVPGLTVQLQESFPDITIIHSPEFLTEKTAAYDAANPNRTILGLPVDSQTHKDAAEAVLAVLPTAPYQKIMTSRESELVKYAGNCYLYTKVLFMNMLYDCVKQSGADYDVVRDALVHDPRIGTSHTQPIHDDGRGAGGHCFIKDFEQFRRYYSEMVDDARSQELLTSMVKYNNHLLRTTKKDIDLLQGVYGDDASS